MRDSLRVIVSLLLVFIVIQMPLPVAGAVYGQIGDQNERTFEYDAQESRTPSAVRMGTSEYYLIAASGDSGSDYDGWVRSIRVWNNNGTIRNGVVSSYEYDTSDGFNPVLVKVENSDSYYAISYVDRSPTRKRIVATIQAWDTNGTIRQSVIDTQDLTYEGGYTATSGNVYASMCYVSNNIYAVAYNYTASAKDNKTYIETVHISPATGMIDNAVNDTQAVGFGMCPHMIALDSDTVLVAYSKNLSSRGDGIMTTFNISSSGAITDYRADNWTFDVAMARFPYLVKLLDDGTTTTLGVAFSDRANDGRFNVTAIYNTGMVKTKSWASGLEFDTSDCLYPYVFRVSQNISMYGVSQIWGISYQWSSADGATKTIPIDTSGAPGAVIDTLEFDTADCISRPTTIYISNINFLTIYEANGNDGMSVSYRIFTNDPPKARYPTPDDNATVVLGTVKNSTLESNGNWYNGSWRFRLPLVIDKTKISATANTILKNFPVMVNFSSSALLNAKADGSDIFFVLDSGGGGYTKLNHEIEWFANGSILAWVNVTKMSSSTNTKLWMYFGNSDAEDQQNKYGTWNSGYLAVYHCNGANNYLNFTDSTANKKNATAQESTPLFQQRTSGYNLGYSVYFDGTDDSIIVPQMFTTHQEFAVQAWVNLSDVVNNRYFFSQFDATNGQICGATTSAPSPSFVSYKNSSENTVPIKIGALEWCMAAWSNTKSGNRGYGRVNSTRTATATTGMYWPSVSVNISDRMATSGTRRAWKGYLDEIRISGVFRNDTWLDTDYNSTRSPSTFMSRGAVEDQNFQSVVVGANISDQGDIINVTWWSNSSSPSLMKMFGRNNTYRSYGSISNRNVSWYEYDLQEGQRPDIMHLGDLTNTYYAIASDGDNGTDHDGYLRTIKAWNNNGTIRRGLVDSFEYYKSDSVAPSIVCVGPDMYAVMFYAASSSGAGGKKEKVCTVGITNSTGDIASSVTDTISLTYDSLNASNCQIMHLNRTVYACLYSASDSDLWLETINISTDGSIADTVIDSQEINITDGVYPRMCRVDGDTIAMVYAGGGSDGILMTWNITDSGNIAASYGNYWKYESTQGLYADIIKVNNSVHAVVCAGSGSDGWIRTIRINNTGQMQRNLIGSYEYDPADGNYNRISYVGDDMYAVSYQWSSADGAIKTLRISPEGDIGAFERDTLEFDLADCIAFAPMVPMGNNYFLIAWETNGADGIVASVNIGTETGYVVKMQNRNFSTGCTRYWWMVNCTDGVGYVQRLFRFTTADIGYVLFGSRKAITGTNNIDNYIVGHRWVSGTKGGTGVSISAYMKVSAGGAAHRARGLLYYDSNNTYVSGSMTEQKIISSETWAWYTFNFNGSVPISPNMTYHICVWGEDTSGYLNYGHDDSTGGGNGIYYDSESYSTTPPSTFADTLYDDNAIMPIYCNYSTAAGPAPPAGKSWRNREMGWLSSQNITNWEAPISGWLSAQNNTKFKPSVTGWLTAENISRFKNVVWGWLTSQNNTRFKTVTYGWLTAENVSLAAWTTRATGWLIAQNVTQFKTSVQGWLSAQNNTKHKAVVQGWLTAQNTTAVTWNGRTSGWISVQNVTRFKTGVQGWIFAENTTLAGWVTRTAGWLAAENTTRHKIVVQGWLTVENISTKVWTARTSGWLSAQNNTRFKNAVSGWLIAENISARTWATRTSGWLSAQNNTRFKNAVSGWLTAENISGKIWTTRASGWLTTQNNTKFKSSLSGWLTAENVSAMGWTSKASGWLSAQNNTRFKNAVSGWLVAENISPKVWTTRTAGWLTSQNNTRFKPSVSGWLIIENVSSKVWTTRTSGWLTSQNNTRFKPSISGWLTAENTSTKGWMDRTTGWLSAQNNTRFKNAVSGWLIAENISTKVWTARTSGWLSAQNNTRFKTVTYGWLTAENLTTYNWLSRQGGWLSAQNNTRFKNAVSGWLTAENTSTKGWMDRTTGWLSAQNNTKFKPSTSGWITAENVSLAAWVTRTSGWLSSQNNTRFKQSVSGWLTAENISGAIWIQRTAGWISAQNNTRFKNSIQGWLSAQNTSPAAWTQRTSGWISAQNDTKFKNEISGWLTAENSSAVVWENKASGWITTMNVSEFKETTSGWLIIENVSLKNWSVVTSGWISIQNDSSFKTEASGWLTAENISVRVWSETNGWITAQNDSKFKDVVSGWLTTECVGEAWMTRDYGWLSATGSGNWTFVSGWITASGTAELSIFADITPNGTINTPITFNVSVVDENYTYLELIVKVDWTTNGTGANETMTGHADNTFTKTIVLGNAVGMLYYRIYAENPVSDRNITSQRQRYVGYNTSRYLYHNNTLHGGLNAFAWMNSSNATAMAKAIGNSFQQALRWNASTQTWETAFIKIFNRYEGNDFSLKPGDAVFAEVSANSTMPVRGFAWSKPDLKVGLNWVGRTDDTNRNGSGRNLHASEVSENITPFGAIMLLYWNSSLQAYKEYIVGISAPEDNFIITPGMAVGIVVYYDSKLEQYGW
jgi:hypothetical protein